MLDRNCVHFGEEISLKGEFLCLPLVQTVTLSQASKTSIFGALTSFILIVNALLSLSRILALWKYYHAPMTVFYTFEAHELPSLLNQSGLLPPDPPDTPKQYLPAVDLSPVRQFGLRLCLAKEWHRFPGHYLVPDGVVVDFVKSDFDGLLPGHFQSAPEKNDWWWLAGIMSVQPAGLNDLNLEEPNHHVSPVSGMHVRPSLLIDDLTRSQSHHAITWSISIFRIIPFHLLSNPAMQLTRPRGSGRSVCRSWMQDTRLY